MGEAQSVVRGLLGSSGLKASVVVCTDACREARDRHRLKQVSATLLAQAIAGGLLAASLQKGDSRVNLQLECDGPLRGLLVDAGAHGDVRGYVKNSFLDLELGQGPFRWRPALGNKGFLSVLRTVRDEFYRSSVELEALSLPEDLERYFRRSDQVETRLAIEVLPVEGEPLGVVAGVLVQRLPDGDAAALARVGDSLGAHLAEALRAPAALNAATLNAATLLERTVPGAEQVYAYPVAWRCTCSRERVLQLLTALGREELQHLLDTRGEAAVTCEFCATRHQVDAAGLAELIRQLPPSPATPS